MPSPSAPNRPATHDPRQAAEAWSRVAASRARLAPHVPLVLHLRGTQEAMGAQHGRLIRDLGGYEAVTDYYPRMAASLLGSGFAHGRRARAEAVLQRVLALGLRPLQRARQRRHPAYVARTRAFFRALGVDDVELMTRNLMVMDVFQNAIGLLSRVGLIEASGAAIAGGSAPGCSSLAVWDAASDDGALRQARNFDFPGIGIWDAAPVVAVCPQSEAPGLRYGFVTTRGADAPGVTAFNEAGLTCVMHTRFHRRISFTGVPAVDLGHEVVRRAETLDDAVRILRELPSASSWGLLISSARERRAVLVETHAGATACTWPTADAPFLSTSNRYRAAALRPGEVQTSPVFVVDSDAREQRLAELAAAALARGTGLGPAELEAALGDICDVTAAPGTRPAMRCAGNTVAVSMTVKSVVCEPESERIRVSVGTAPTGWGPYLPVAWDWEAPVGVRALSSEVLDAHPERLPLRDDGVRVGAAEQAVMALQTEASRLHQGSQGDPTTLHALVSRCVETLPDDPHLQLLASFCALERGAFAEALGHLGRGLELEGGVFRRGQMLLWAARAAHADSQPERAEAYREALLALEHPHLAGYQRAARREQRRPLAARRLRRIAINYCAVDAVPA